MESRNRNQTIFLATPEQLTCLECYLWLWTTARSLTHLSSAGIITAIEALFRDLDILGIEIRLPNGTLYKIPFIFDVFGEDLESGRRWMTNFRKAAPNGIGPASHCDCIPKLQCIDLLLQCTVAKYRRGPDTPRCSFSHVPLGW